ncbi:MAG: hypothetical protein KF681_01345 [Bdellovibrionaceae bacterium]|nr:hypothetical protein [Pseudobdellovibrionaceae bacterium]
MIDHVSLLQICEDKVRTGEDSWAVRELSRLDSAEIPRELRLGFANLCRRLSMINVGLKILAPVVLQSRDFRGLAPSAAEKSEYAVLLQRTGAVPEALRLLESIDQRQWPQALLLQAFCHFNRWEYEASLPLLHRYLESSLDPYARLVGEVNLAAALIVVHRLEEAEDLLARTLQSTHDMGHHRLRGNCFELRNQIHLARGHFLKARADLTQSLEIFKGVGGLDSFFAFKWKAVLDSLESQEPSLLRPLMALANERRDWETAREAALFAQKAGFDRDGFHHLYFGTPFAGYRERIERYLGQRPSKADWILGPEDAPRLDLETGHGNVNELKSGHKVHQVLAALLRDLYRPSSLGGLFNELFPGEHFNAYSSPDRIHQLLARTRRWIEQESLPFDLTEDAGHYRLQIRGDFAFRLSLHPQSPKTDQVRLIALREKLPAGQYFTSAEGSAVLGLSVSSFKRWAARALEAGSLQRAGQGSGTLYKVAA